MDLSPDEGFSRLKAVLKEAESDFTIDQGLFYSHKIFKLGRFIGLSSNLMKSFNMTKDEICSRIPEFDKFLLEWDKFLQKIEKKVTMIIII